MTGPFEYPDTELFFGVVAPVGTDLGPLVTTVSAHLQRFRYRTHPRRLSDFLRERSVARRHGVRLRLSSEYSRISSLMDAGNKMREVSARRDILALYAASEVSSSRREAWLPATAQVFLTLKRPEEVAALRQIYGPGFFLVGVYTPEDDRLEYLQQEKEMSEAQAKKLVERDEDEGLPFGQRTRATFHLADVFFRLGNDLRAFQAEVRRFIDLVFGDPFVTPTREEQAMFLAHTASLRSADLSRQVGAIIVSGTGELLATGANDVPRFGGGAYWPGKDDQRDYVRGYDSNKVAIEEIVAEVIDRLAPDGDSVKGDELERRLAGSRLYDLTEFGRAVHAEMDALTSCGRKGLSAKGGTMYTTTFPCHNCAKHIVAAGIEEVQYVEPYPKSRAQELHGDSISVDARDSKKVSFLPFVGVSARRYVDLFSMQLSTGRPLQRKASDGVKKAHFDRTKANPRVPLLPVSYIDHEVKASRDVLDIMRRGESHGEEEGRPRDRHNQQAGVLDSPSPERRARLRVARVETRRNTSTRHRARQG